MGAPFRASPAGLHLGGSRIGPALPQRATGDARPDTLVYLRVQEVDRVAAQFGVPVEDAPWAREVELQDRDRNRLRIGTPT